jgi:hypothetical protein
MAAANDDAKYSITDVFSIVHEALWTFYEKETVKITYEKYNDNNNNEDNDNNEANENEGERILDVPTLEFIMNRIGHEIADRWSSSKKALEGMHLALDVYGDYSDFTFDVDAFVGKISYRGGSRRKSRKSRKTRKLRR